MFLVIKTISFPCEFRLATYMCEYSMHEEGLHYRARCDSALTSLVHSFLSYGAFFGKTERFKHFR